MFYKPAVTLLLILTLFCTAGYPAGFLVYNQDAASAAMGNAFTAVADNASAVFYNPAGMHQLHGTQIRSGVQLVIPHTSFRGAASGVKTDMHDTISAPVTGYITHKVNDIISLGGGVFTPFGLVTEWPSRWEGSDVSIHSDLRTFFVNPAVSVKLHPRLALAAGIDYVYADFKIRRSVGLSQLTGMPINFPLGKITLDGFDDSWGYNAGMLFHINDTWRWGIAYRSKINLEFDGHAHYRMRPVLKPLFSPTDISPRIELPPLVATHVAAQFGGKWTVAAGCIWTGWSVYDELAPRFRNDLLIPARMKISPQEWRDVFAYQAGIAYRLNSTWILRGGYIFDQTPVPERTLGPMVPDADGHLFSAGFGYERNGVVVDVGSMLMFFKDRHTRRNVDGLNGEYTSTTLTLLVSLAYTF